MGMIEGWASQTFGRLCHLLGVLSLNLLKKGDFEARLIPLFTPAIATRSAEVGVGEIVSIFGYTPEGLSGLGNT